MNLPHLISLADKISDQRHVKAINRSFMLIIPIAVLGSLATMVNNFPLLALPKFMVAFGGSPWTMWGDTIVNGTFAIISILFVIANSYFLAESHELVKTRTIHPLTAAMVSLACFFALILPLDYQEIAGISFSWIGKSGLFIAIIVALIATELFLWLCTLRKINICLYCDDAEPIIGQAMACVIPVTITLSVFVVFKVLASVANISDIHQTIHLAVKSFVVNIDSTIYMAILYNALVHLFWFFGIHGSDFFQPIMQDLYGPAGHTNMALAALGGQATEIFTDAFFNHFVFIGGVGSTLCLIIALQLISKRGNMIRLAQLSLLPGVFNINELIIFGLPIVLNPIYMIPFLLTPVILTIVSYIAMVTGLVPVTTQFAVWTTPTLLSGYLVTGSWWGTTLQLLNIIIGVFVYLPFVVFAEKRKLLEIKQAFSNFVRQVDFIETKSSQRLLARRDCEGNIARILSHDLKGALAAGQLFLEYQPQVNHANRVIGVEALLRWNHSIFGRIPPPVIIAIAEELGIIGDLGKWIINEACRQMREWKAVGIGDVRLAINVSVLQLYQGTLAEEVFQAVQENGLVPEEVEIEITEKMALNDDYRILDTLNKLHARGIQIAIDDFGMGHSSIRYIKYFPIDTLKIDRSLSHDVLEDKNYQKIIATITSLCSSLNIKVIVEYVESIEQRDMLNQLGCWQYQGYLYSPALPPAKVVEYIDTMQQHGPEQQGNHCS